MISEVRDELEDYRQRCENLHEEFRERLRVRDNARSELTELDEQMKPLQMEGISLLGNFSAAISSTEGDKLREVERDYKNHSRNLGKSEKHRERLARKLENAELDEQEAAQELRTAISEILDEYSQCVQERKQWLAGLVEILEDQLEELGQAAAPLMKEYESHQPPEGLPRQKEIPNRRR